MINENELGVFAVGSTALLVVCLAAGPSSLVSVHHPRSPLPTSNLQNLLSFAIIALLIGYHVVTADPKKRID